MAGIKDPEGINHILKRFIPAPTQYDAARFSLDEMKKLLTYLGEPQKTFKTIHVAGTSGKTSTSYYIAALLAASGKKVGLTISPHVDRVNERVQINLKPLPEHEFGQEFGEFLEVIKGSAIEPSYFAVIIAFAYWFFAKRGVDYAVVEVGMGGLLDATNVEFNPDKVCVITDIGLDHMSVLGNTVESIAAQKVGIIQQHNVVFTYQQSPEVMQVVEQTVEAKQAALHEIEVKKRVPSANSLPRFQRRNWYLALRVYEYIAERDGLHKLSNNLLAKAAKVYIPARMEIIQQGSHTIIMDGAHNSQKLKVLLDSIREKYPQTPIAALISFVDRKEETIENSLKEIEPAINYAAITSFAGAQDAPNISIEPQKVAAKFTALGFNEYAIEPDPKDALGKLLTRPEQLLLITGSFYLLNHIRPLLKIKQEP